MLVTFFKENTLTYDFIYIDGDHDADQVLRDAIHAFEVLNPKGIIAFDDYEYFPQYPDYKKPKTAIDSFISCYADQINIIRCHKQCWIQKL